MQSRRDFIKSAAALGAMAAWSQATPESIRRALAIEPEKGSTFLDAEHVVILMQENRSFDHAFGMLRGVRGFNDPRAITLPDGLPVWAQANESGQRFVPFRLDIKNTKITWMGSLPHSWTDQIDARNDGKHDRWLPAKKSGHAEYAAMPLTMGYYSREDIPFYYALADAFTICDQHFCSSLTGTTPNRLHFWTGTIRQAPTPDAPAAVRNEDTDHRYGERWTTFPERLEKQGVSWKIYQNELSTPSGLKGEQDAWLSNFTDNPIEWFERFNGRFAATHRAWVPKEIERLRAELAATQPQPGDDKAVEKIQKLKHALATLEAEAVKFTEENFQKLTPTEKSLHARAFCTNAGDPAYRELDEIEYSDGDVRRRVKVPKGDVLHQFRKDVESGELPAVSWLVAPERFSDHPGSAWYGAWYIAETLDILTRNPEVWKKTIFILTYDENDGYFDHVPPFTPPHPTRRDAGKASSGIDTAVEHVELEQDLKRKPAKDARGGPIGLGYRVPMVIASPWTRGGCVCSQVFDHTSVLQFLETFLAHKRGKKIEETNITAWRRTVCGDLTAAFGPADAKADPLPFEKRDVFIEQIHQAQFKGLPAAGRPLTDAELQAIRSATTETPPWPSQEPGVRRATPLPYELEVNGRLSDDGTTFIISFEAKKDRFGERAAGAPFIVYALAGDDVKVRNYAVRAGDRLEDSWSLRDFAAGRCHLRIYGPNGFYREFTDGGQRPLSSVDVQACPPQTSGKESAGEVKVRIAPAANESLQVQIQDNSYRGERQQRTLRPGEEGLFTVQTSHSFGWYDFTVEIDGHPNFSRRYAGKVETGRWTFSDPAMGRVSV